MRDELKSVFKYLLDFAKHPEQYNDDMIAYLKVEQVIPLLEYVDNLNKEIEKLREENLLLRASEPMSKLAEDYGYKAEVEKLNRLILQKEQKWEKWTTEKQILSSKMSDYLCKYQNIKREYTKQIKISTDRKKEIERLNNKINSIFSNFEQFINSNKNDTIDDFFIVLRLSEVVEFYNDLKEVIKSE